MQEIQHVKDFFSKVRFEEKRHLYFVEEKQLEISVSGIVKRFVEEVDFDSISYSIDERDNLPLGTTKKFWSLKSDVACSKGNKAHFFGQIYAFHRNISPGDKYEEAVKKFWDELPPHLIPVFTELEMYHLKYMFGGMADIILYNTITKKFIIVDYKTNEDLFKNFRGKKLLKPFHYILENDYNKYNIQFSLYQILFEQTGYEVENRVLVWLKPDGTYDMFFTEDYSVILKEYLEEKY